MEFIKLDGYKVERNDIVKVTSMGNVTELLYMKRKNNECPIKMIDKDHYIVISDESGEVRECKHIENRSEDESNIRRTMRTLRNLINANITDEENCRFVTLTYSENMTDEKRLKSDLMNFNVRLRSVVGNYEYIAVREPQGRGAWHFHVILIFPKKAPFLSSKLIDSCWKKGFVTTTRLDNVDNVGAYLTAYLCDVELNEAQEYGLIKDKDQIVTKDVLVNVDAGDETSGDLNDARARAVIEKKQFVKGARLCLYPPNMNLYTCSKGIKKPIAEYMTEKNAQKKISSAKLTFSSAIQLIDSNSSFENIIYKRYYNSKRK